MYAYPFNILVEEECEILGTLSFEYQLLMNYGIYYKIVHCFDDFTTFAFYNRLRSRGVYYWVLACQENWFLPSQEYYYALHLEKSTWCGLFCEQKLLKLLIDEHGMTQQS